METLLGEFKKSTLIFEDVFRGIDVANIFIYCYSGAGVMENQFGK